MKILYAADNRSSSQDTLIRFLENYGKFYDIKVAGYTKSLGNNIHANWNLDALLDFTGLNKYLDFRSRNFALLCREIDRFKPDVIISDLEPFCSYAAIQLGLTVWQISPLLIYWALRYRYGINKYHSCSTIGNLNNHKYIKYLIKNSNRNFILSHLGDINDSPELLDGFEWLRPNSKSISGNESIKAKGITLADCYYNNIKAEVHIDWSDPESILTYKINKMYLKQDYATIDDKIKFLGQHLVDIKIERR